MVLERKERENQLFLSLCGREGGVYYYTLDLSPRVALTETVGTVGGACVSPTIILQGICYIIKVSLSFCQKSLSSFFLHRTCIQI